MGNIENIDKFSTSDEDFDFLEESVITSDSLGTPVDFNNENEIKDPKLNESENDKSEELYETDTDFRTEHIRKTQGREVDEDWFMSPIAKGYMYKEGNESTGIIQYPLLLMNIRTQEMSDLVFKSILKGKIVNDIVPDIYGKKLYIYQEVEGEAFYSGEFVVTSDELFRLNNLGIEMKWVPEKGKRETLSPEDIFDFSVFNPKILDIEPEIDLESLNASSVFGDIGSFEENEGVTNQPLENENELDITRDFTKEVIIDDISKNHLVDEILRKLDSKLSIPDSNNEEVTEANSSSLNWDYEEDDEEDDDYDDD